MTDAFGGQGGIAQYNRDFLAAIAGDQFSIRVLTRTLATPAELPDNLQQYFPGGGRFGFATVALASALIRPVDVVFCGHIHLAPLAAVIARLKGAKLVLQAHGIEVWKPSHCLRNQAAEMSDVVFCVSRHTRQALLAWAGIPPERALVIPNTVGDVFTPGDGAAFRRQHGCEEKKLLLTVGRMDSRERYKGHDRVIAALPTLINAGHDVVYLIVGTGDDRTRLETRAASAGVSDCVRFLGELRSHELVEAYRAADLFVMPSTGEGFGISFLEAMACGTPALGLNAGGAPDALADGELGTAVEESAFVGALASLLTQPKRDRYELSTAVRARFGHARFQTLVREAIGRIGLPQPVFERVNEGEPLTMAPAVTQ